MARPGSTSSAASLTGGRVLLTGATGGIGKAIARAFAARSAQLVLTGRRADVLEALAAETRGEALTCDLADREAVARLGSFAGDFDVLVANAALPASGELTELTLEQTDRMLEVNLRAPIALAHALTPGMVARRRGHLVFIASLSGKFASPGASMYSASKFGLRGFALGLRAELGTQGVGVSVINPGFVSEAGMFADTGVALPPGVGTVTPENVAAAVIRAIERNRAEIDVAPAGLRIGAGLAQIAPQTSATVARWAGSGRIARRMSAAQVAKR